MKGTEMKRERDMGSVKPFCQMETAIRDTMRTEKDTDRCGTTGVFVRSELTLRPQIIFLGWLSLTVLSDREHIASRMEQDMWEIITRT